jgi:hypothetical protein
MHKSNAAQIRSRNKTSNVSHHSPTHSDQKRVPVRTTSHKVSREQFDRPQAFRRLSVIHQMKGAGTFHVNAAP